MREENISPGGFNRALRSGRVACCSAVLATTAAFLAGCSGGAPSTGEAHAYTQSIDRYYDGRPLCLWPDQVSFPVKNAPSDEVAERGYNALADAGLLVRLPEARHSAPNTYSFDLSARGRAAFEPDVLQKGAGNFCYGRRSVTGVDTAREATRSTESVSYRYGVPAPAAWATDDRVQAAFPQIASEIQGQHAAQLTLLDTTDGWQVSGAPTEVDATGAQHQPALAKAMALLHLGSRKGAASEAVILR